MDIIEALTAHHATLRHLLRAAENDPSLFDEAVKHLVVHHTMEEKYFYEILVKLPQSRHDALEYINEHHIVDLIINDAKSMPRDHELYAVKVEGLGEYTSHHLDEEEVEVFPAARQVLGQQTLDELAVKFEQAKKALLGVQVPEVDDGLVQGDARSDGAPPASDEQGIGLGIGSLKQTSS